MNTFVLITIFVIGLMIFCSFLDHRKWKRRHSIKLKQDALYHFKYNIKAKVMREDDHSRCDSAFCREC